MDFSLTDEQRAIREAARDFARQEVSPRVEEHDESQEYPRELMRRAAELGFLGVIFPEELGGAGLGYVEYVLVVTELSKVDPSVGISVAAHNSLCTNHIFKFGDDAQRRRWVPKLATGEWIGAWALTEAGSGSDAAAARATARKVDGGWVLDGSKAFCTHGAVGDVVVVMAITDPAGRKGRNMSAFVVERGAAGLRAGKKENKLGIRASDTSEVVLDNCFVPDDQLLGQPGDGFRQALQVLDGGRISIAALGLGTAIGAYETAMKYAKERRQFDQPIAEFQAIRFKIARMATDIEAARQLMYYVCDEIDKKRRCDREAAMVKLFASEMVERVTSEGLQIFGGYGYSQEFPAQRFWRDGRLFRIFEGTSEIQAENIAKRLLGS